MLFRRLLKKPVHQGRRREKTGSVASGYVEDGFEERTKLKACFRKIPAERSKRLFT